MQSGSIPLIPMLSMPPASSNGPASSGFEIYFDRRQVKAVPPVSGTPASLWGLFSVRLFLVGLFPVRLLAWCRIA